MRVAILGGGLTGLTVGYLLNERGVEFEILEKEGRCGGLMRTVEQDGFTFDAGGSHVIFSKDEAALHFMLNLIKGNEVKNKRNSKILYKGACVRYPFENGLADLPREDNFKCLYSFVQNSLANASSQRVPANFNEWCYFTFGSGIAERYLIPYNEKIWKFPSERMSTEWVQRIPYPPLEDIIKSSLGFDTQGYKEQLFFYYPQLGGIEALIRSLQKKIEGCIVTSWEAKKIRKERQKWLVSDGTHERQYDRIISTIPVPNLIKALSADRLIKATAKKLKYNSLITVMFGLTTANKNNFSWLYIPDSDILTHRISFPSNYSKYTAPEGRTSILAEITCSVGDAIWKMKDMDIIQRVSKDLGKCKLLSEADICYRRVERSKYAYVLNDLDRQRNMSIIHNYLRSIGIDIVGRFAEFEYLNMDGCIRHAINFVDEKYSEE
ncbi:MAG: protoporphyrinogen/coproporphyrinogen oxidase [Halobacteriota archaeon]